MQNYRYLSHFIEPVVSELDEKRERAKEKRQRITYDCHNAMYPKTGEKVYCQLGHQISLCKSGRSMRLDLVLEGRTGFGCRSCPDFDRED